MTAATTAPQYESVDRPRALSTDWLYCGIATGVLLVLYLLLQNPYWVPGGDSEVYTSIARNLLIGKHYTFNGQPVSMVPPGWPWFLAAAMRISPTFVVLKMLTMLCMLGNLCASYFICRRYAPPALCLIAILLTGTLSYVYQLTFWLHSDALFCLTSSLSLLLALQINEQVRPHPWRIAALIILCSASVMVRWAGLLTWLTVAAALLEGTVRPRFNRRWIALLLSGAVTAGTFVVIRAALHIDKQTIVEMEKYGGQQAGEAGSEPGPAAIVKGADNKVSESYAFFNPAAGGVRGMVGRFLGWGNWYSYLLWQPFRIGHANNAVGLFGQWIGWVVLASVAVIAVVRGRYFGQWIWAVLLIYSLALAMNWPQPNARYLVPIAPLILLGALLFFSWVLQTYRGPRVKIFTLGTLSVFVASLILCNGLLYACDVWVARSTTQFYEKYDAGLESDLISAAKWLNDHNVGEGQVAVCQRYVNLGKVRNSWLGLRATTMLTNRAIFSVPRRYTDKYGDPRDYPPFLAWARQTVGVKYYLFQPDISPWRVFHFRMAWLQKLMTKQDVVVDSGAGWRLYAIPATGSAERISIKPIEGWPTRVPGL